MKGHIAVSYRPLDRWPLGALTATGDRRWGAKVQIVASEPVVWPTDPLAEVVLFAASLSEDLSDGAASDLYARLATYFLDAAAGS